jgi:glucose-1-phosphate thymidylyltransferase
MKGIVMAGGTGTRLYPLTKVLSKQLLPVHNKPMIYYPIATLMLAGIREIAIITRPEDKKLFQDQLGSGSRFGVSFNYISQNQPNGIAEAFVVAENFIRNSKVALVLGDNLFHGSGVGFKLRNATETEGANIFASVVSDPQNYGVVELDDLGIAKSIEEKPIKPKSNYAIPGLYFYNDEVLEFAKTLKPSARGELEISSLNQIYLMQNKLKVTVLERGTAWLDTGTFENLHTASTYVKIVEERQGKMIACLEEIAFRNEWINTVQLNRIIQEYPQDEYKRYLSGVLAEFSAGVDKLSYIDK